MLLRTSRAVLPMVVASTLLGCAEIAAATGDDGGAPPADHPAPITLRAPLLVDASATVDAGPACARSAVDANAAATRAGGFALRVGDGPHAGIGPCQTWQGGRDRWVRFTAPEAGLWRVSARGAELWSFSAHRACEGADTERACRRFTDYHAADPFSQPLALDLELAAGETTYLLASGCGSGACSWSIDIAPPITFAGRCTLDGSSACSAGWFCRAASGLPSGVGACVEATPPSLDEARAFAWEGAVRLRVVGGDTSRDVSAALVELLDADGASLGESRAWLALDDADRFVGRGLVYPDARALDALRSLRVTLVDAQGLRSAAREVPLGPPLLVGPGQPCDPAGVDNVCPDRYVCGAAEWGGPACAPRP